MFSTEGSFGYAQDFGCRLPLRSRLHSASTYRSSIPCGPQIRKDLRAFMFWQACRFCGCDLPHERVIIGWAIAKKFKARTKPSAIQSQRRRREDSLAHTGGVAAKAASRKCGYA